MVIPPVPWAANFSVCLDFQGHQVKQLYWRIKWLFQGRSSCYREAKKAEFWLLCIPLHIPIPCCWDNLCSPSSFSFLQTGSLLHRAKNIREYSFRRKSLTWAAQRGKTIANGIWLLLGHTATANYSPNELEPSKGLTSAIWWSQLNSGYASLVSHCSTN